MEHLHTKNLQGLEQLIMPPHSLLILFLLYLMIAAQPPLRFLSLHTMLNHPHLQPLNTSTTPSSFSLPPMHNQCTLLLLYPKKARVPFIEQAILLIPPKKYQFVGHLITRRMMFPSSRITSKDPLHSSLPHLAFLHILSILGHQHLYNSVEQTFHHL